MEEGEAGRTFKEVDPLATSVDGLLTSDPMLECGPRNPMNAGEGALAEVFRTLLKLQQFACNL